MSGILHRVRLATRKFGIDIGRWPGLDPTHMLVKLLDSRSVTAVLDVGANSGRYGLELRDAGYAGRILSYEPLPGPFEELSSCAAKDDAWEVFPYAVGDAARSVTINVAANAGESSSVLPMLPAHIDAYPTATYVDTHHAEMRTLDDLALPRLREGETAFLKADVQGFERPVLDGAKRLLAAHCVGMQLELSFTPLYEGAMLYREALDLAQELGFVLMGLIPGFVDLRDGRLLQADGIFMRESP
jgi:FkbM family methyltransferase